MPTKIFVNLPVNNLERSASLEEQKRPDSGIRHAPCRVDLCDPHANHAKSHRGVTHC